MRDRYAVLLLAGGVLLAACSDNRGATADSTAAVASTDSLAAPQCGRAFITGEGIGALQIGLAVERVHTLCNVTEDTVLRFTEGQMARVLTIALDTDTVMAEIVNDRVWRILVRSQGLYTADSVSVGSSIMMLARFPDLNPIVGEGYLYAATASHCGMSFRLSEPPSSAPHGEWTSADLRSLAPLVHVTRILVFGCSLQR